MDTGSRSSGEPVSKPQAQRPYDGSLLRKVTNRSHSAFDDRFRILASMPFDRSPTGAEIAKSKVIAGTEAEDTSNT